MTRRDRTRTGNVYPRGKSSEGSHDDPARKAARLTEVLGFWTVTDPKLTLISHGARDTTDFRNDPVSAAYASDLENLIDEFRPPLWVHGHTHTSFDYEIRGTRIACNPRGYWPDELNPEFDWGKVFEV